MSNDLKKQLLKLGSTNPELQPHIKPLLASIQKEASGTFWQAEGEAYSDYVLLTKRLLGYVHFLRSDGGNVDAAWLRSIAESTSVQELILEVRISGNPFLTKGDAQDIIDLVQDMARMEARVLLLGALQNVAEDLASEGKGIQLTGQSTTFVNVWLPWLYRKGKGKMGLNKDRVFFSFQGHTFQKAFKPLPIEDGKVSSPVFRRWGQSVAKLILNELSSWKDEP